MNLRDYLRTSEAAEYLGVSPGTVRNCERQGRLRARRLAHNGYRLFLRKDQENFMREAVEPTKEPPRAPRSTGKRRQGKAS